MVHHEAQRAARRGQCPHLSEGALGPRSVVHDAEGVHEVVGLVGKRRRELFGIRLDEPDPLVQSKHTRAFTSEAQRLAGKVDGRHACACTSEADRVRADAASHLEHALAAPALELRKCGNVRLHSVLPCFDLVEVLVRADGLGRVAQIAGT